jgi:hypothetical protein
MRNSNERSGLSDTLGCRPMKILGDHPNEEYRLINAAQETGRCVFYRSLPNVFLRGRQPIWRIDERSLRKRLRVVKRSTAWVSGDKL